MKKRRIMLLSIFLTIVLLISGIYLLKDKIFDLSKEATIKVSAENQDKTIMQENGDVIYIPSDEEVGYDSEEEIFFYENLLNISLVSEISNEQAEELASVVGGKLVGKIQGSINMLQIQVEGESLHDLYQLANQLVNDELVAFADASTPSFISDFSDRDVEGEVEGDWWIESIHAPDAWEYLDNNSGEFEETKVGVLETGRLGEKKKEIYDDDLRENVSEVDNSRGKDFRRMNRDEEEVIDSHARWVTKFIVADSDENTHSFRGVAEGKEAAEVIFTAIGNKVPDYKFTERFKFWKVPEPYIFSMIQSHLDKDIKVINLSLGDPLLSEQAWENSTIKDETEGYEGYKNAHKNSIDKVSAQLIVALDRLLDDSSDSKKDDFLIIQAAGNGEGRFEHEIDKDKDEEWSGNCNRSKKFRIFYEY